MAKRVFLEHDAAEKSPDGAAGAARPRPEVGKLLATLSPFIALFPALLLLLASIKALNPLVGEARSAKALLLGYRNWYITMICAVVVGVLLVAIGIFIAVKKGMRTRQALRVMAVSLALFLVVSGLMLVKEEVPALLSQAQADLRQIEEDRLETVTVWLHPKSRAAGLPGPYTQGRRSPPFVMAASGRTRMGHGSISMCPTPWIFPWIRTRSTVRARASRGIRKTRGSTGSAIRSIFTWSSPSLRWNKRGPWVPGGRGLNIPRFFGLSEHRPVVK